MLRIKPRNASFTLEERLNLVKFIKAKISIIESRVNDAVMNQTKIATWNEIHNQFLDMYPERHNATARDIRELWRRMKHRARTEVRQKVCRATRSAQKIRPQQGEIDDMGWMLESNQTVFNITDLGLEPDTEAITSFVPLLEEQETFLEAKNGFVQSVAQNDTYQGNVQTVGNDKHPISIRNFDDDASVEVVEYCDDDLAEDEQHLVPRLHIASDIPTSTNQHPVKLVPAQLYPVQEKLLVPAPRVSKSSQTVQSAIVKAEPSEVVLLGTPHEHTEPTSFCTSSSEDNEKFAKVSLQYLQEEHDAKMALIKLKTEAVKAKNEVARAKRAAYDEKRIFYFEKRKKLHDYTSEGR